MLILRFGHAWEPLGRGKSGHELHSTPPFYLAMLLETLPAVIQEILGPLAFNCRVLFRSTGVDLFQMPFFGREVAVLMWPQG